MRKKLILSFLFISFFLIASLYGCSTKDKEILLSSDVQSDIKDTENKILEYISEGKSYLDNKEFDSARASFEKAITKDKSKSESYLEIKNLYMETERYDDAYYFIKLAIDNDIDKDNMLSILEDIKKNFEVVKHDVSVKLNNSYNINENMTISIPINGVNTDVSFKLDNISSLTAIDTSAENTYTFNASSYEYGHSAVINVIVRKPVIKNMIGYIKKYYDSNGDSYISFDECEFFRGEAAYNEYIKDSPGSMGPQDDYHLRNNSPSTIDYKISNACKYSICAYMLDPYISNLDNILSNSGIPSSSPLEVNKDIFGKYFTDSIKRFTSLESTTSKALLFWITTEDDIITKMEMQFTP